MAKRDIPEINAGSMADIAFLLLIFFLVTTTMDRDKAYIRDIPKNVEVVIPPAPVPERDILAIKANSANQLMVRDELMENPDDISERILEFYRINSELSGDAMMAAMGDPNHPGNNFPFYSRISKAGIESRIQAAIKAAEEVEEQEGAEETLISFMWNEVSQWEKKKFALNLYGKKMLPEISSQAHIRIEVQDRTDYELFAKIQSEIEEAIFEMRDDSAKEIFGLGYASIIAKLADDASNLEYKAKFDLLKLLYPDRIIEVTPKN